MTGSRSFSPARLGSIQKLPHGYIRTLLGLLLLGVLAATVDALPIFQAASIPNRTDKDAAPLEPGKPVERELAGGQGHTYRIALASGQFLRVAVDQKGIDVALRLLGPDGKQLLEMDNPDSTQGRETVSVIAEISGNYELEVLSQAKDAPAGHYAIRIEELRAANEQDRA